MSDRFAAFRHSSYTRYFFSRFLTSFGAQVVSVSVAWQMYDETRNPALLGWIGLVQFLPALLLSSSRATRRTGLAAASSWAAARW